MRKFLKDFLSCSKCGRQVVWRCCAIVTLDKLQRLGYFSLNNNSLAIDGDNPDLTSVSDLLTPIDDCVIVAINQDGQLVSLVYNLMREHGVDPKSEGWPR